MIAIGGAASAAMMSNPYTAIASVVLSALSAPKIDISQAAAQSGFGIFEPENNIKRNKRLVDFSNPASVAIVAACVVGGIYIYKKHLR